MSKAAVLVCLPKAVTFTPDRLSHLGDLFAINHAIKLWDSLPAPPAAAYFMDPLEELASSVISIRSSTTTKYIQRANEPTWRADLEIKGVEVLDVADDPSTHVFTNPNPWQTTLLVGPAMTTLVAYQHVVKVLRYDRVYLANCPGGMNHDEVGQPMSPHAGPDRDQEDLTLGRKHRGYIRTAHTLRLWAQSAREQGRAQTYVLDETSLLRLPAKGAPGIPLLPKWKACRAARSLGFRLGIR